MTRAKPKAAPTRTVTPDDPADHTGRLKRIGGSTSDAFNNTLASDVVQTLWLKNSSPEIEKRQIQAAAAALIGIAPKSELEGMLAAQLVAAHAASMECYRRAMIGEQSFEGRKENLNQANKLSRTYVTLLEALDRHRGKSSQQKVTVEHVHVHAGGQAIVGTVDTNPQTGGGGADGNREQPHTKALAYAPVTPLRCAGQDEGRESMPLASNVERPLSHARGRLDGRATG